MVWPANTVEIRVGSPDDAIDDLWYDGEALVFGYDGLVERRVAPADPWTLAALTRSWLRELRVSPPTVPAPAAPVAAAPAPATPPTPHLWLDLGAGPASRLPDRTPSLATHLAAGRQSQGLRLGGALDGELSEGEQGLLRVARLGAGVQVALELPGPPRAIAAIQAELGLCVAWLHPTQGEATQLVRPRSAVALQVSRRGQGPALPFAAARAVIEPERDLLGGTEVSAEVVPAVARLGVEAGVHLGRRP